MALIVNTLHPVPTRRRVTARVIAPVGWYDQGAGVREAVTAWTADIDDDGTWELNLPANATFDADDTFYRITEPGASHSCVVPAGPGPVQLRAIAIIDPLAIACCPPPPAGSVADGARTLEELLDVEGTDLAVPGDTLIRSVDGPWRPGAVQIPGGYRHQQAAPAALVQVPHGLPFAPAGVLCTDTLGQLTEPDRITNPLLGITEVLFGAPFSGEIAVS